MGITIEAFEAHLAKRPYVDILGERPLAPSGARRFLNRNHVDFAVAGLPSTDALRAIQQLMHFRGIGEIMIDHCRLDPSGRKLSFCRTIHRMLAVRERIARLTPRGGYARADDPGSVDPALVHDPD